MQNTEERRKHELGRIQVRDHWRSGGGRSIEVVLNQNEPTSEPPPSFKQTDECFVGIDISKAHLDVAYWPTGRTTRFPNSDDGIGTLVTELNTRAPILVVYEPIGVTCRELVRALKDANVPVAAINPLRIRNFARALNRSAKTDRLDSLTIAEFASTMRPIASRTPEEDELELRDLVGRRRQIASMVRDEKTRKAHAGADDAVSSINRILVCLIEESATIEKQIDRKIESRIEWREKRILLETFKGVGPIGSATLVADLPELGHLDSRKIAALVGLAPMSHESGDAAKRRRIKGGRMHVRNALYMCAIAATRTNKPIRDMYLRLRNANKPPNIARVAVMRKMLVILNAMARDGTAWRHIDDQSPKKTENIYYR